MPGLTCAFERLGRGSAIINTKPCIYFEGCKILLSRLRLPLGLHAQGAATAGGCCRLAAISAGLIVTLLVQWCVL